MHYTMLPIIIDFIIYALIIFAIAYLANKRTANLQDYVLGARCFSGPVTALGAGASDMSSWLLMALPGTVYLHGLSMIWMPLALILGAYCNWKFIAARLRVYTEIAGNSLTIPEFFANRFKDNCIILRLVTALAIICFFIFYTVSGFVAGAELVKLVFAIDYHLALLISAGTIIAYTVVGGFLAVNWIDFFQGSLMFFALLAVPITTITELDGVTSVLMEIHRAAPQYLNPLLNINFLGIVSLLAWGLGYFGQPHINVRFMAIKHVRELGIARRICMTWMILSLAGAVLTGLVGFVYFMQTPLPASSAELIFIELSRAVFTPWNTGIMLSAILSAIMSTVAAMVLMISNIIVEDVYRPFVRKQATEREYLLISKLVLLLAAIIPVAIAAQPQVTIFQAVGFAWSGLGAAFGPTLLFCLFWRRMTKQGAITGIAVGAITVLVWGMLRYLQFGLFADPEFLPGFEILPGFIFSSLAIIIVSKCTTAPTTQVVAEYDQVNEFFNS